MKSSFISLGIAGMLLMAACSTSNYTQKSTPDDLYSGNASSAPAVHHSQTNSQNSQTNSQNNTSSSDQVIDPPVIVDRSTDNSVDNSSGGYDNNGSYDNNGENGYNGYDNNNGYSGYGDNNNNSGGSSWDNSAMNRMGYASSSFGFYGPTYSGFTMYSPMYYSPGFSMSLGFSFGTSMFYSPAWNSYPWMPPPPPVYYAPYPYPPAMYNPYCMNPYAYMDPYGYYGGLYNNYYYGSYYPSPYYSNNYYGPRNSPGNNTSSGNSAKVYGPGRSSNPVPPVNSNSHITNTVVPSTHNAYPVNGNNGQQMQGVRRSTVPAVAPAAPRTAPSENSNSGRPKNEFRPMPQAFGTEQQPGVIYRNNLNHEARPQNTERFHQTLNEESKSRNFEQHPVQNTQRSSSTTSNSPHTNGTHQYR